MDDNKQIWTAFLEPLRGQKHSPRKDQYDVKTIERTSCMSRDLAIKLEQEVEVEEDEVTGSQHRTKPINLKRNQPPENIQTNTGSSKKPKIEALPSEQETTILQKANTLP